MQPTLQQSEYINSDTVFHFLYTIAINFFSVNWLNVMYVVLTLLVIVLITIILYTLVRLYEIKKEAAKKSNSHTTPTGGPVSTGEQVIVTTLEGGVSKINETWNHIRARLLSDNQSEWRLAIIEADIYMDRVLDTKGFHGDTVGDKLKQITPAQFGAIQIAWEAHKVRNRIAHDGAGFTLTMPEARRVLSYYEIIFRDLEVIE